MKVLQKEVQNRRQKRRTLCTMILLLLSENYWGGLRYEVLRSKHFSGGMIMDGARETRDESEEVQRS